jgi:TolB-like protein/class 3 adenylate cyclase
MSKGRVERRLAAIMAVDVVGYSRLMGADEEGTLAALKAIRSELGDPKIAEHRGRIVKTTGDGLLVEFASVVDAVRCAVEVQQGMAGRNADVPADKRIEFRFGIHQGDIIIDDGDIFGDGVNLAARLEGLAEPGGICVSRVVRDEIRDKLDFAFKDMGEQSLKNMARPTRVFAVNIGTRASCSPAAGTGATRPMEEPAPLALPDKPSLAVLPFQNMSGDPEQEYFTDGMVEEIITALSRIRWLFVIARNSSFTYKGQTVDVKQVGRELGVRYVLEGSVRKAGGRVRITGQLIDTETGAHLWADRFDGSIDDIFDLQDQVANRVAGVIEPALRAAETRRLAARPRTDATAYDLCLRALPIFYTLTKDGILEALRLFEQAIGRDPAYGPALAWASNCHMWRYLDGWTDDLESARRDSVSLAKRAIEVAGDDPVVLAAAVGALARFGDDIGPLITLLERCLELDPSSARGWYVSGLLHLYAGNTDLAIGHTENSLRLSPRERMGAHLSVIGTALFFNRQFGAAVGKLQLAIHERPTNPPPYRALASCYAHMGLLEQAQETIARLRAVPALVIPNALPWRKPEDQELWLSGLRLAMGETA